MSLDLSKLSIPELVQLQKDLVLEIPRRMNAEKQKVLDDLKKMAADRGFSLDDLLGAKAPAAKATKARGSAAVKYRSKDGKEWSGRGRKPLWLVEHLNAGGALADLSV